MASKNKYYVVWNGVNPGIYSTWDECQLQIKGFKGAAYKGFETREEAEQAFSATPSEYRKGTKIISPARQLPRELYDAVAVDASCLGNPGKMEYRGVWVADGSPIFKAGPFEDGTNNIGEFLALVHALAWMEQQGMHFTVCSDSRNAISWVKQKKCKTKLERTGRNDKIFELITRAERWLATHKLTVPIVKWETKLWGEIPADFGRK